MAAGFTEDQIKAMIFGLEEEENGKIVEYPCIEEEEPTAAEVQLPSKIQATQVPPLTPQAPLECGTVAKELPHQTVVVNGDSPSKKRIPRPCPVPECRGKVYAKLWNH